MKVGFLFLLAALALLSETHGLTCEDAVAAFIDEAFKEIDGNGDTSVSFKDQTAFVEDFDSDDNGVITEAEFRKAMAKHVPEAEALTTKLMRAMDANKDDILTDEEANIYLSSVDADRNGRVTPQESRKFWTPLLTHILKEAGETPMNCTW